MSDPGELLAAGVPAAHDAAAGAANVTASPGVAAADAAAIGTASAAVVLVDPSHAAAGATAAADADGGDASLLALVDRLAALFERTDLAELEVESGGTGIVLRRASALAPAPVAGAAPEPPAPRSGAPSKSGAHARHADAAAPADAPVPGGREAVLAPLTGIFYSSPSPGTPPFVEAGREVLAGQVIGLIEAMKLFNEIKSDKSGRVVRVVPDNGTLVKAKQPLIEVEPL